SCASCHRTIPPRRAWILKQGPKCGLQQEQSDQPSMPESGVYRISQFGPHRLSTPVSNWLSRVCGPNPGPKRRMSLYSREERMKAVKLYFQYDRQVAPVLRELGYPSRGALRRWVAEVEATG